MDQSKTETEPREKQMRLFLYIDIFFKSFSYGVFHGDEIIRFEFFPPPLRFERPRRVMQIHYQCRPVATNINRQFSENINKNISCYSNVY